jgi:tetratricopeptide (TPR) repeat protein
MAKTRKKPKRRRKGRQPPKKERKSSSSIFKWILIFSAIAVAGTAAILGAKSLFHSSLDTQKQKPNLPPTRPADDSTVPTKLTAEREAAVLKKAEIELIELVMKDFPNNEDALKLMGDFHSRHGSRTEAVKFWQQCLDMNPRRPDVYSSLGDVAIENGEYEEAVAQFRKAIEIESKANGIRDKIGHALVELGRYDEAINVLEEERSVSPSSVKVHFLLGQAYFKQKEYEKARVHYHQAVEIAPEYENAYYGLARVYAALKQREKAREYQKKFRDIEDLRSKEEIAISTGPDLYTRDLAGLRKAVIKTHLDAEKLYLARADVAKTEEILKRAIDFDPNNSTCYERLGTLYTMSNRLTEAVRQFQRISEIEPSNIFSYLNIGEISTKLKMYDAAEAAYAKVIKIAPQQAVGYRELSSLYLMTNTKLIEAGKLAQKAVNLEQSAESFFVLGWALDVNGDRSGASKAIQEAIKLEPNNPKYRQIYERIKGTN